MDLIDQASTDAPVPAPIDPAADAAKPSGPEPFKGVPEPLREALRAREFDDLTAVQRAVLEADAEGRDLQISSQTGSGKTVALGFVLAKALMEELPDGVSEEVGAPEIVGPEALIIVPTRELATQVCEELDWLFAKLPDVDVVSVTGGTPMGRDRHILRSAPRVLVGTPGRLLDHVQSGMIKLGSVRALVLDEADQMLDMGFREELEGILDTTPPTRRTHLVSATFPDGIRRLAERYQAKPVTIEGTRLGDANQDIEHIGFLIDNRQRYAALVNLLLLGEGERTLVFVERRADALEIADRLEEDGFAALPLSGELVQSQRERTLAAFRAGQVQVLVATDVAARGLDVPDVATVIHTAPPIDSQVYTHRSGRTGRAGKRGRSVLFAPPNRRRKVGWLLHDAGVDLRWRPVPSAAEVREKVEARAKAALVERLDAALAEGPPKSQLELARELLVERDATSVVAALLDRMEPKRRAEAQDVKSARPDGDFRNRGGDSRGRDGYRSDRGRPSYEGHGNGGYSRGGDRRGGRPERQDRGDSVRFFVNWGNNQGANPSRLLAAICRRGEVSGGDIGSIAIHPNASTFDVAAHVAERFERLAGRRDPRDPQTHIRRDRGPQAGGGRSGRPQSGGHSSGGYSSGGHSSGGYRGGGQKSGNWRSDGPRSGGSGQRGYQSGGGNYRGRRP